MPYTTHIKCADIGDNIQTYMHCSSTLLQNAIMLVDAKKQVYVTFNVKMTFGDGGSR